MPTPDPLESQASDETILAWILFEGGGHRGLYFDQQRVRFDPIRRAILRRRIAPIVNSREYRRATDRARLRLIEAHLGLSEKAARRAWREVGLTLSAVAAATLTARIAEKMARLFLRQVESSNRRNLSRLVRNASNRYQRAPSTALLDELMVEIKAQVGLPPTKSRQVAKTIKLADAAKVTPTNAQAAIKKKANTLARARANAAARHQLSVAVNTVRHEAWGEAISSGELPALLKRWRDQEDDAVRLRHSQQTAEGPIPFDQLYGVFQVQHPPAPEFGCRCYEDVVIPPGSLPAGAAV